MSMLVVGLGSDWGADALGWVVVHGLQGYGLPKTVSLLQCGHPVEMLEPLLHADAAIIVDACIGDGVAGQLQEIGLDDIEPGYRQVHGIGVVEVLRLAATLGLRTERLWIYGLMVPSGDAVLNPAWVDQAVPELARIVLEKSAEVRGVGVLANL